MSFSNLKAARQQKQRKPSFLSSDSLASSSSDAQNEPQTTPAESSQAKNSGDIGAEKTSVNEIAQSSSENRKLYAALPSTLEIRQTEKAGRSIWSKTKITTGTVLFAVQPRVSVLSSQHLSSHCSACASRPNSLKRCTRCQVVHYCDSECQTSDWPSHKDECQALQRWSASASSTLRVSSSTKLEDEAAMVQVPGEAVRCIGRILWRRRKEGPDSTWVKEVDLLQSHRTTPAPPKSLAASIEAQSQNIANLAHMLVHYMGASSPMDLQEFRLQSAGDLVDLISRFTTNTFTLVSPTLDPLGVTISPVVALFNHSCDPNAVVVFPNKGGGASKRTPMMHVVALKDIQPGEEVFTSYVDLTLPRTQRQGELRETYHFECECLACCGSLDSDPRETMYCPKRCGGTCRIPQNESNIPRCAKCRAPVPDITGVLDAIRLGNDALVKAERLQFSDPAKALQLTTKLPPILASAGLTPSSHPFLALTRLRLALLISSLPQSDNADSGLTKDALDEMIQVAAKVVSALSVVLVEGHPVRGIAFTELGKLLAVDEPSDVSTAVARPGTGQNQNQNSGNAFPPTGPARLQLAHSTLVRAHSELLIGFGRANEGGEVGREVRALIVRLERELGTWNQGIRNVLMDTTGSRLKVKGPNNV